MCSMSLTRWYVNDDSDLEIMLWWCCYLFTRRLAQEQAMEVVFEVIWGLSSPNLFKKWCSKVHLFSNISLSTKVLHSRTPSFKVRVKTPGFQPIFVARLKLRYGNSSIMGSFTQEALSNLDYKVPQFLTLHLNSWVSF